MTVRGCPLLILLVLTMFGCKRSAQVITIDSTPATSPTVTTTDPELAVNLSLWNGSGIHDYDMEIDSLFGNGIGGPANNVKISVRNGVAVSIVSQRPKDTRPVKAYEKVETIEKMFHYIQELRQQSLTSGKTDAKGRRYPGVRVEFDKELGYPKEIGIVWELAMDAFTNYEVKKLTPIRSTNANQ